MDSGREEFVKVRKRDVEKLTTEVMQLREFLPKVLNRDLVETIRKAGMMETMMERAEFEQKQLRQDCLHLHSRMDAAHRECQKEREENLGLRQRLSLGQELLQQQADFCTALGSAACTLLWSVSVKEEAVKDILAGSYIEPFLALAGQTLESFVSSLNPVKMEKEDSSCQEHQFVLAVAGIITNIAAVPSGRDFLSSSAHILLNTMMRLLGAMKPGVFSKLKVLILMTLYNVSISVKGLQLLGQSTSLPQLLQGLLQDGEAEVSLHSLRLLHSLALEAGPVSEVGVALRNGPTLDRLHQLSCSHHAAVCQAAREVLDDLAELDNPHGWDNPSDEPTRRRGPTSDPE
ncbi:heat shock factor 2-binding protein isoform X1 [Brienomyrus brachyistius]|uniref:heat shock factor 2-binding protein isoform X1 n=3 Tax=Brienomyrus brachyistius TaxID=42636 RepID=UPI0020B268F0|nr:heat shock factor 2-binding protein isoform X1 [Brienomyrus brachyistius]